MSKLNYLLILLSLTGCHENKSIKETCQVQESTIVHGEYICGDFHQHTTYSGGDYSMGYTMKASKHFGLDWWANNDHGGVRELWGMASGKDLGTEVKWENTGIQLLGNPHPKQWMWRWQSLKDWSFKDILHWRERFPENIIIQGFEWNVPGHEHADVSIIRHQFDTEAPHCSPLAQFEYMFDEADKDQTGGKMFDWEKCLLQGHTKTLAAIKWLQTHYPRESWIIPTHPERSNRYTIADLRDMNNAGPSVCFGFDGQPGHQKNKTRGFGTKNIYTHGQISGEKGATFGGTGIFCARIGGVWDALLSEGRHWWIFANSDFHSLSDFHPGEYQKTYTWVKEKTAHGIVDGLRSGNSFISNGDLITDLRFKIQNAVMGECAKVRKGDSIHIQIKIYDPDTLNYNHYSNYTNPSVDHLDVILGHVSSYIQPHTPEYQIDSTTTTKVIARFDATGNQKDIHGIISQPWIDHHNGWKEMTLSIKINQNAYVRLRATNNPLNTPEEVDAAGNPLPDIENENSAAKAFSDLWFYSNPIFIEVE